MPLSTREVGYVFGVSFNVPEKEKLTNKAKTQTALKFPFSGGTERLGRARHFDGNQEVF